MKLFNFVPNFLTLTNLFFGCIAVVFGVMGDLEKLALFVSLGLICDFFDGFFARLLKVDNKLGVQLDSLSDLDWDSTLMTDEQLTMYYDFNDSDLVWFKGPENSARLIKYKFPHEGHYLVATQWYNRCLNQDTFFFTRITIKCDKKSGVTIYLYGKRTPRVGRKMGHLTEIF